MTAPFKKPGNPFTYPGAITLDTLGDLFAHHRAHTGGHSMSITPPEPTPTNPPNQPNQPAPAPPAPPAPAAFEAITSQEEFDQRLGQRLAREREKYADYDDLKTKAAQLDEITEANRTEQEKAVEAARKEGEATARKASDARILVAEAKAALATAQAKNPAAAVKLLDLTGLTVDDAGEVDPTALKAKIDALKGSDDYLFGDGKPTPPRPDPSQGGGGGDTGDKPGSIAEARRRAREEREAKKSPKTA